MAIIFGDRNNNTIAAAAAGTTIFGMGGADILLSDFEKADLRGGWGADYLHVAYTYNVASGETLPVQKWSLAGDEGDDLITVNAMLHVSPSATQVIGNVNTEAIIDGGSGNDSVISKLLFGEIQPNYSGNVNISQAVVDLSGDNSIELQIFIDTIDNLMSTSQTAICGAGNDKLNIISNSYGDNYSGVSSLTIDLGDGVNNTRISTVTGSFSIDYASGSGSDFVLINIFADNANDVGFIANGSFDLGGGNDTISLQFDGHIVEYSAVSFLFNLGAGDNYMSINAFFGGYFEVNAGSGKDEIQIYMNDNVASEVSSYGVRIDAGDGDNLVVLKHDSGSTTTVVPSVILSGSGADIIVLEGKESTSVFSGSGSDLIFAGYGADTISGGAGGDSLTVAKSIFDARGWTPQQTLTLTDFSLADLDKLTLTGFTLAGALADGILNTAADFLALKVPGGDVLSFVQTGADALLTLNLGAGETGQILFQNFTIPVLDAPRSFTGTSANNVFVGGNNADQFFLKLGQDRATGNTGADLFRVNAVTAHNTNGDRHTITDLNFAEGDVLRFDNFGSAWANNAVNPANDLQYVAGSFNNWVVNSLADLRELRDSGAVTVSTITGGSRIAFEDQAGDDMQIDLLGIII